MSNRHTISTLLFVLFVFDVCLTVWAFVFPDLWFRAFHGVPYDDPQGFLRRCGANWAAFAGCQFVAWWRWKQAPYWLAVVAGVRLSDIFTDITYVIVCQDRTWFAEATLPGMGVINLLLGLYLLRQYRRVRAATA